MANMSYCRFQNTLTDLEDCVNHMALINECLENPDYNWIEDPENAAISREELTAMRRLIRSSESVLENAYGYDEDGYGREDCQSGILKLIDDFTSDILLEELAENDSQEAKLNLCHKFEIWCPEEDLKDIRKIRKEIEMEA